MRVSALLAIYAACGIGAVARAQEPTASDSTRRRAHTLTPTVVTAPRDVPAIGHLPDVQGAFIFSGLKTEVIRVDSLRANAAQDVSRQMLGRIPGAIISETEGSGFPSNGIGFRGLDPTQSIDVNTRQNGVNIAADLYGYPETYYVPPMEAVDHIDVIRGAASLQFGPQFGGAVNYVLKDGAPNTPPKLTSQQTGASFGTFNTFNALGGGAGPWTYYGFVQYRTDGGWRPNSDFRQGTGYGKIGYHVSDRLSLSLDYSGFRNYIHMPGGLSDAQWAADPRSSYRARNWLESPWNIMSLTADYRVGDRAQLITTASYMISARSLVWRNEDGGPQALDTLDTTGQYAVREVQRESFRNFTTETRLRVDHAAFGVPNTLATGVRLFLGSMGRQGGGPGSRGSNFDLRLYGGSYGYDLVFGTQNIAAYVENTIHVTNRLSVTPGLREEYLYSTARGYTDIGSFHPAAKPRSYPLAGVGAEYALGAEGGGTGATQLYANITTAYRPITYDALTPFASASVIDPKLHDAKGYNADLGWRGTPVPGLSLDVGVFYLRYDDRIGLVPFGSTAEVTNVANSAHRGVESYVEIDPFALARRAPGLGTVKVFDAFAYVDARYLNGTYKGNEVENAPPIVNRAGVTYGLGAFSTTAQVSHTATSYADASNAIADPANPGPIGIIPAYRVIDWSGTLLVARRYRVQFGVNNLADAHYFTRRTNEYPGPGIIPAIGRSVYAGIGVTTQ